MTDTHPLSGTAKIGFASIAEKNRTIDRILAVLGEKNGFLLLGHELPDEDCISSLVSMALVIKKFHKNVSVCITDKIPDQLSYLVNICVYNQITLLRECDSLEHRPEAVIVLDTPKPDMIAAPPCAKKLIEDRAVRVIELDHHLSADAACTGDPGYCLVARATSTCELIALLCYKLSCKPELLEKHKIDELYSRNLVLSLLTGMIGDTRLGLTLKKNRDIFFYKHFTHRFSGILQSTVRKNSGNYSSMTDIFDTLQSLSPVELDLYRELLERAHYFGRTGYMVIPEEETAKYMAGVEYPTFVKVIKAVTDFLSEKSGTLGLTVYYDPPEVSDLIQFRVRISRRVTDIDLRKLLMDFSITDGGGHPGAIGFRFPRSQLPSLTDYLVTLLEKLETV